jgi:uncharacterized membrane protein
VAALAVLGVLILALGPLLSQIPLNVLQLVIGVLLLLFGLGWLRKAILRAGGVLALRDEDAKFAEGTRQFTEDAQRHARNLDWIAGLAAFKGVLLEGLEVVFIVIAVGAGGRMLGPAALGAAAACAVVLAAGVIIRKPLTKVPENSLKFAVGVMLSAFGVFWTGEGVGVQWPGGDLTLLGLAALFLATGLLTATALRRTLEPERA